MTINMGFEADENMLYAATSKIKLNIVLKPE